MMLQILVLLAIFTLSNCCPRDDTKSHFKSFGTKTTYTQAQGELVDLPRWSPPAGFTPVFMYAFIRHGIRYPGTDDITGWRSFFDDNKFPAWMDSGHCSKSNWPPMRIKLSDDEHITQSGYDEISAFGSRVASTFHDLIKKSQIDIGVSEKPRTNETAFSFFKGIDKVIKLPKSFSSKVDPITTFNEECDKIAGGYDDSARKQAIKSFKKRDDVKHTVKEIAKRLPDVDIDWDAVKLLRKACASSVAVFNEYSPICSVFQTSHLELMNMYADIKDYYSESHGAPSMVTESPCVVINEFLGKLDSTVRQLKSSSPSTSSIVLRFSHTGAMLPLVSHLGLYKDSKNTMDPKHLKPTDPRQWHSSHVVPFMGNVMFVVLKADNKKSASNQNLYVATLVNEKIHELSNCDGTQQMCSLANFKRRANYIGRLFGHTSCNLNKICKN